MVTHVKIRIVYIAGPYRAPTIDGIMRNIVAAREVAIQVWKAGLIPLCPHLNSACMDGVVSDQVFLDGDLAILARCDAVLCVSGYQDSDGARTEVAFANDNEIPIYDTIEELKHDVFESQEN